MLKRISPTALQAFERASEKFVATYVLGAQREPQSPAMAVGSAFDARVKGQIEADLLGRKNRWEALFEEQVDRRHVKFCLKASEEAMQKYVDTGAYAALLEEVAAFEGEPRFEFTSERILRINDLDVPIYGKPDGWFLLPECNFVLDWKVNGYCSKATIQAGFREIRMAGRPKSLPHRSAVLMQKHGMQITMHGSLKSDWMTQLGIYTMMIDAPDRPWIVGLDQLAFDFKNKLSVGVFRQIIRDSDLQDIKNRLYRCWSALIDQHYFWKLSKEESDEKFEGMKNLDPIDLALIVSGGRGY